MKSDKGERRKGLKRERGHINFLPLKRGGGWRVNRGFTIQGQQAIGAKENVYIRKDDLFGTLTWPPVH